MIRLTSLLFFITATVFSQHAKKEYFFDEEKQPVSYKTFLEKDNIPGIIPYYYENDSLKIGRLFYAKNVGKVNNKDLSDIRVYLEKLSGKTIDTTQIIVINYYHGTDKKHSGRGTINSKEYPKKLKEIGNIAQFWLYKTDRNLRKFYRIRSMQWLHDSEKIIEKNFFPADFLYGSYVVIHPNGNCEAHYGEYGLHTLLESLKNLIEHNAN
jgi:hypothetical protein